MSIQISTSRSVLRELKQVAGEAEDVEVVVPAAELGGDFVDAGGRPHAGKLVGGDRHADAGAADENAAVDFAAADLAGHQGGEIRVVDAGVGGRTVVDDLVPLGFEQRNHLLLEVISAVIAGDGNLSSQLPFVVRSASQLTRPGMASR